MQLGWGPRNVESREEGRIFLSIPVSTVVGANTLPCSALPSVFLSSPAARGSQQVLFSQKPFGCF